MCCISSSTKRGTTKRPVDEAGFDDLGDPAIDDGAGIDHDVRVALSWTGRAGGATAAHQTHGLGRGDQVTPLGHRQSQHAEPEEDRDPQGSPLADRPLDLPEGEAQEQTHEQAYQQAGDGGHELGGGELLDARDQPRSGHDREIRQKTEADDHPGDDPGRQQGAGVVRVSEQPTADPGEHQPDEAAEGGTQHTDISDHSTLDGSSGATEAP